MRDRDRLAADLHAMYVPPGPDWYGDLADRLIALGWTRLDEERLARALEAVRYHAIYIEAMTSESMAAAIAKAYREDTDAHD